MSYLNTREGQIYGKYMEDVTGRKDLWCRMFVRTLEGDVIHWCIDLPNGRINNFDELKISRSIQTVRVIRQNNIFWSMNSYKKLRCFGNSIIFERS